MRAIRGPCRAARAEVSQRIAEAVFLALVQAIPDKVTAAPAGSSGNFALGGFDPAKGAGYVDVPDLRRRLRRQRRPRRPAPTAAPPSASPRASRWRCWSSTIRSCSSALRCARARAGRRAARRLRRALRGGAAARRGARLVRDGPRPLRPAGRAAAAATARPTWCACIGGGETFIPEHLSKDQDIALRAGDRVEVMTPGGGGYGNALAREPALVAARCGRGYYTRRAGRALYGVALTADGASIGGDVPPQSGSADMSSSRELGQAERRPNAGRHGCAGSSLDPTRSPVGRGETMPAITVP